MPDMSLFEVMMLLCFGAAWPFSIWKSWHARNNGGKSPIFLAIVCLGYVAGILHKALYQYDAVIWLYALNGCMVFCDLLLYRRNARSASMVKTEGLIPEKTLPPDVRGQGIRS